MQYMIMNYVPQTGVADKAGAPNDPDGPAWGAYTKALIDAGVMRGGNALQPCQRHFESDPGLSSAPT